MRPRGAAGYPGMFTVSFQTVSLPLNSLLIQQRLAAYKIRIPRSYRLSFMATFASLLSASEGEDATESDAKGPISLPILRIGKIYTYTIPSFPVLSVQLRHVKYQMISQGKIGVFEFMRECPSLERSYPAKAVITAHPDAFFIEVSVFTFSVHILYMPVLVCVLCVCITVFVTVYVFILNDITIKIHYWLRDRF